jgi:hypothetical protein
MKVTVVKIEHGIHVTKQSKQWTKKTKPYNKNEPTQREGRVWTRMGRSCIHKWNEFELEPTTKGINCHPMNIKKTLGEQRALTTTNLKNQLTNKRPIRIEVLIRTGRKGAKVKTIYLRDCAAPVKRTENHKNNHHEI